MVAGYRRGMQQSLVSSVPVTANAVLADGQMRWLDGRQTKLYLIG